MKGKYITTLTILACLGKPRDLEKDIHSKLRTTIAEYKKILEALNDVSKEQAIIFEVVNKKEAA